MKMDVLGHLKLTTNSALLLVLSALVPARSIDVGASPLLGQMISGWIDMVPAAALTMIGIAPSLNGPPSAHGAGG
jgi:hypothetical protein